MDFCRRFQYRRLCLLGPDGRQSRARACLRPLSHAHYRALRAPFTPISSPAGAFRGFGVPQSALAQEQLYDELATSSASIRLEFRILNALRAGDRP
jgi:aldehyde oxidoreductase